MGEKFRLSHENYIAISRDMIKITDFILKLVVSKTEQAALEIGEKIQNVSSLSSDQSKLVKNLMTSMYEDGTKEHDEVEELAQEANQMVDQIFESALQGDLETAQKIGDSEHYKKIGHKTGQMTKQLEQLSESDKELANMIAPVIMALQFQDSVRQSLENLIWSFHEIEQMSEGMAQAKLPPAFGGTFWVKLENKFTSTEERNIVRKVVYGENAKLIQVADKNDPFLF